MKRDLFKKQSGEEPMLISQWKEGKDPKVLEKIIANHYLMIYSIANFYSAMGFNREDLISEGFLGIF
jgi:DNA-directed RNA polymerase sigma subunit (sigma70/sigma32)